MKAKRSKKDYLKTTQRIKAQVGEQPCLKIEQSLHLLESSNKEGTFEVLLEKHLKPFKASNDILIEEEVQNVHPLTYDTIDSEMVRDAIIKMRSAGPSSLDADC